MSQQRSGIVKVVVIVILAILVGVAFMMMNQEQEARAAAEAVNDTLGELIESGGASPTPEEIHEKIGRKPHETRVPGKHRYVEEYHWKGPMGEHTVYAYYTTGATKLLEAVSLNQKLEDWEGDALKVRQN